MKNGPVEGCDENTSFEFGIIEYVLFPRCWLLHVQDTLSTKTFFLTILAFEDFVCARSRHIKVGKVHLAGFLLTSALPMRIVPPSVIPEANGACGSRISVQEIVIVFAKLPYATFVQQLTEPDVLSTTLIH